jgi:rhodanese-related sulfurtransferase
MLNALGSSQIDAREIFKKIQAGNNDFTLLDVRTPGEYSREKIAGSINLPVDLVAEQIETVIPNKNATVYVYCLSGSRSVEAVVVMRGMGYKKVFNMVSGLLAWRVYKLPLEK